MDIGRVFFFPLPILQRALPVLLKCMRHVQAGLKYSAHKSLLWLFISGWTSPSLTNSRSLAIFDFAPLIAKWFLIEVQLTETYWGWVESGTERAETILHVCNFLFILFILLLLLSTTSWLATNVLFTATNYTPRRKITFLSLCVVLLWSILLLLATVGKLYFFLL